LNKATVLSGVSANAPRAANAVLASPARSFHARFASASLNSVVFLDAGISGTSHTKNVLSERPDTSLLPSGEKARLVTSAANLVSRRSSLPRRRSQSRISCEGPEKASTLPSGENATARMLLFPPGSNKSSAPEAISHRRNVSICWPESGASSPAGIGPHVFVTSSRESGKKAIGHVCPLSVGNVSTCLPVDISSTRIGPLPPGSFGPPSPPLPWDAANRRASGDITTPKSAGPRVRLNNRLPVIASQPVTTRGPLLFWGSCKREAINVLPSEDRSKYPRSGFLGGSGSSNVTTRCSRPLIASNSISLPSSQSRRSVSASDEKTKARDKEYD